jgi:hypothetical protein
MALGIVRRLKKLNQHMPQYHKYPLPFTMDSEHTPRRKKGDKAKEKFDKNGKNTTRHVREAERLQEKRKDEPKKK